jgi:DNA polymerase I
MVTVATDSLINSNFDQTPNRDEFLLIDGHAIIYRAYHAFPELTDPNGQLVNAVYGFARILLVAIRDFDPEYIAVCFDSKAKTLRAQEHDFYKANRAEMPDDLKPQIELVSQLVKALSIPQFAIPGYEADDLIGTLATQNALPEIQTQVKDGLLTVIVTGDKDLLQLVNDTTHVWLPRRNRHQTDLEYDAHLVEEKMGVRPDQIVDLKALMGDASDNIPGVKGIGQKTAVKLLNRHQTLAKVYDRVAQLELGESDDLIKGAMLTKLVTGKSNAYLSKELAQIQVKSPISSCLEDCKITGYDKAKAVELFTQLGFSSLIKLLPKDEFEQGVQTALF